MIEPQLQQRTKDAIESCDWLTNRTGTVLARKQVEYVGQLLRDLMAALATTEQDRAQCRAERDKTRRSLTLANDLWIRFEKEAEAARSTLISAVEPLKVYRNGHIGCRAVYVPNWPDLSAEECERQAYDSRCAMCLQVDQLLSSKLPDPKSP